MNFTLSGCSLSQKWSTVYPCCVYSDCMNECCSVVSNAQGKVSGKPPTLNNNLKIVQVCLETVVL